MHTLARTTLLAAMALAPMSAPAVARAKADYARQCQIEVKPKGYYSYDSSAGIPVVRPAEGGTAEEAARLNACIQARATGRTAPASAATPVQEYGAQAPTYTKRQRGASALSGGAGYHGSYLEGGTGQGASLTAPEGKRKTWWQRVFGGVGGKGVSLPAGYPLMPGDEALWNSLTVAQQERARRFLEDGSTIRSSLKPDY